jgi:hypothetical protein
MDPYLEHPVLWTSVHTRLMVWMAHQLTPRLRARYVVFVEERTFIEGAEQQRVPDVWVQKVRDGTGQTAVAEPAVDTPLVLEVEDLEVHEHYLEILDRYHDMRVVTVVEVVNPANKFAGPGRNAYLAKRSETWATKCHLVEIDLLRRGPHVLSIPEAGVRAKADYDYLVCVNRWPHRKRWEYYPRRIRERLPTIHLPLIASDPDVRLDIQAALEQVYDDGSYMLRVRYDEACEPALPLADQQWASECWAAYRKARPDLFPPPPPDQTGGPEAGTS